MFNLLDPLDNIPLSKTEIKKIFLPATEKMTQELVRKYENLDTVIGQLKSWQKSKTKSIKAAIPILGNKILLR